MATSITITGGNLYQIAAQYYNDATQFVRLMQVNNLSDPMLSGTNTIIIPSIDPSASGGLPS